VDKTKAAIEELLHNNASDFEIAKVIKAEINEYFKTLPALYQQNGGKDFLLKHTQKIDNIIKLVYKITLRSMFGNFMPMKNGIPVSIAALGSYGREQLCVYSDIDLMIVYQDTPAYNTKEIIEKMLYMFWDIGLKLGHRVHEIYELQEAANSDITIKSAILESRYIDGSRVLWTEVENRITAIRKDEPKKYIYAKLHEQKMLHQKSPLSMEPNLKEGVGGFRDANLVFWIGKLLYNAPRIKDLPNTIIEEDDYQKFRISLEFLFRVRSALHLASGKKVDRLSLELIPQIASMMGYADTPKAHINFAKKTTGSLRIIYLYSKIWIEAMIGEMMPDLYSNCLDLATPQKNLYGIINFLNKNANMAFEVHPKLLKSIIHANKLELLDQKLYKSVKEIFNQPHSYSTLKALHTARVLKYIIPPLKKVIDLPQFDGYHRYSVDMHSLRALWHLENIKDDQLNQIYTQLNKKEKQLLKLVVLLHDCGKGRKKDHAMVGASLFRIFAQKLDIDKNLLNIGIKLIQHHDLMSITAQREDLYNEKTILQFASIFSSKKELDLIYLLTYSDLNGVGSGVYNDFTAKLISKLYQESIGSLQHDTILSMTARKLKKISSLKRNNNFVALPKTLQRKILSIPSNELFVYNGIDRILEITKRAEETERFSYHIQCKPMLSIEITRRDDLNIGYLLSELTRINLVNLQISKLYDGLKYFRIEFNESVPKEDKELIEKTIIDSFDTTKEASIVKPKIKKSEIEIDCKHSREYASMRIKTKDQKGLLAYTMKMFDTYNIDIASSKIYTGKHRVNDLFLIQKDGNFCNNTDRIIKELTE